MNVLISAYACQPNTGSEPGIGWNWVVQAARNHRVWVITREENRTTIEAELRQRPIDNVSFVYHELPAGLMQLASFGRRIGLGPYPHMLLWQSTASGVAIQLHRECSFDVAHHVTYGSVRSWSYLAKLNVPYIWGSVGGLEEPTLRALRGYPCSCIAKELLRIFSNRIVPWIPAIRSTARRAALVLATTSETSTQLTKMFGLEVPIVPNIGIAAPTDPPKNHTERSGPIRLLFVGRLVCWKGVDLAIEAVATLEGSGADIVLDIVGTGSDVVRLRKLVRRLALDDRINFLGAVARDEVQTRMIAADIFVFPSLHDSGGFVVLEAMAAGLPVICINAGGPALAVTKDCGVKVQAGNRQEVVTELGSAIARLATDEQMRSQLGQNGYRRVIEEYAWDDRAALSDRLYRLAVAGKPQ